MQLRLTKLGFTTSSSCILVFLLLQSKVEHSIQHNSERIADKSTIRRSVYNDQGDSENSEYLMRESQQRLKYGDLPNWHLETDKEFLNRNLIERTCSSDRGCQRREKLNETYLRYCSRYRLENLLSNEVLMSILHDSADDCQRVLHDFIRLDETIEMFDDLFKTLLSRYNCHNGYSVKWSCDDCKTAYKDWICSINLPYYMNGELVKPCISFCERVEQRCPYLHPIFKEQYGGQPVFICRDPNIPFVSEITPDIPYSEPSKCYDLCHLSENRTELLIDSLSKYDIELCPDKISIAKEVRGEATHCNINLDNRIMTTSDIGFTTEPTLETNNTHILAPNDDKYHKFLHQKKYDQLKETMILYKSQPRTHAWGHH